MIKQIKEIENNTEDLFDRTKREFERLREIHLNNYLLDKTRMEILKTTNEDCLKILDEIMESFIEKQLQILTFSKNGVETIVLGLSSHFHKMSAVKTEFSKYPVKCFSTFLRSKLFGKNILERGFCSIKIPTAFLEYVTEYYMKHKNKQELQEERDFSKELKRINFDFLKQKKVKKEAEDYSNDNIIDF